MNINALIAGVEDFSAVLDRGDPLTILKFGGTILLIGMTTVFAVLVTIWMSLVLFKLAFSADKSRKKLKDEPALAPVEAPAIVSNSTDEEIVAVIAAAIAMAESESDGMKFRVVSFKRR